MPAHFLALLGHPVAHTLSPAIHHAAARTLGLDIRYEAFDVPPGRLAAAVAGLMALGSLGANLTNPHKVAVIPMLDACTPNAGRIGAVNVLIFEDERVVGDNTDALGFVEAVRNDGGVEPAGSTAAIVGAGGAGRAIAFGLAEAGVAKLLLANRTRARVDELARDIRSAFASVTVRVVDAAGDEAASLTREADIVVNATNLGWARSDSSPLGPEFFGNGRLAVDTVYASAATPFLAAARAAGARTLDGLAMLVAQGALAFERWTGHVPSRPAMRRAAEEERGKRTPSRPETRVR